MSVCEILSRDIGSPGRTAVHKAVLDEVVPALDRHDGADAEAGIIPVPGYAWKRSRREPSEQDITKALID